jgi:hypothetical protein
VHCSPKKKPLAEPPQQRLPLLKLHLLRPQLPKHLLLTHQPLEFVIFKPFVKTGISAVLNSAQTPFHSF